jgi:type IV fimbrial biogenesis protein FimT
MAVVTGKCRSFLSQNGGIIRLRGFERVFLDIKGFTLAEMMAVAGVVAVLMAVAVPNYLAFQPNMRLNGASREVLGKLMWARSKAVEENAIYDVTFPTDHTLEIRKAGMLIQTVDIQTEYTGVTFSKSGDDPAFNSRGTAGGATTITIMNSSGSKTVTVTATGNVRIS